jgi:hypothetical protein
MHMVKTQSGKIKQNIISSSQLQLLFRVALGIVIMTNEIIPAMIFP